MSNRSRQVGLVTDKMVFVFSVAHKTYYNRDFYITYILS